MRKNVLTFLFSIPLVFVYSQDANKSLLNVTQLRCYNSQFDTTWTNTSNNITWKRTQNPDYSDLLPKDAVIRETDSKTNGNQLYNEKKTNK